MAEIIRNRKQNYANFFNEIKIKDYDDELISKFTDEINTYGNAVIHDVLSEEEINKAKSILLNLSKKSNTLRLQSPELEHKIFLELIVHPLCRKIWKICLGGDPICSHFDGNIISGYSEADIWWHIDHPNMLSDIYPENLVGQTIIMLDDFTEENGATKIIPGSHKKGVGPDNFIDSINKNEIPSKTICGKKGSFSFTMGGVWHTAGVNKTNKSRVALVIMYVAPHTVRNHDMTRAIIKYKNLPKFVEKTLGSAAWIPLPRQSVSDKKDIIFKITNKIINLIPIKIIEYVYMMITKRLYDERKKMWGFDGKISSKEKNS